MPHSPQPWWQRLLSRRPTEQSPDRNGPFSRAAGWATKPKAPRPEFAEYEWTFAGGSMTERAMAVRLHRFMRDQIPILKAVVWTWTRLAAAPSRFEVVDGVPEAEKNRPKKVLSALPRRIHPDRLTRFGGFDALLIQYFDAAET